MLSPCIAGGEGIPERDRSKIYIDDEPWTLAREAEKCEGRAEAALLRYWQAPLYRWERMAVPDRFLVNETPDCWIELTIEGVTETSVIFKVSPDKVVLDARLFSNWLPRVSLYPDSPIYLE